MVKSVTNPLYLFGVIEESEELKNWKRNATKEYKNYRNKWHARPEDQEKGNFPLSINVEITRRCNLACTFCWHKDLEQELKIDMSMDMFKKVIDESRKFGLPAVNLNGLGEPMLHPEIIEMIKYCKRSGVLEVMFHTNGTVMNKQLAKELIKSGLDIIIFSLDSPEKKTYEEMRIKANFDAVQKNVECFINTKKELGEIKPFVRATMVLTEKTVKQVEGFKKRWSGKVDSITFQDLLFGANSNVGEGDSKKFKGQENARIEINEKNVMEFQKKENLSFVCPYLYQSLKIHPSGDVSACSPQEAPKVGKLEEGLANIWSGKRMETIRSKHECGKWMEIESCKRCDVPYMEITKIMNSKNNAERN